MEADICTHRPRFERTYCSQCGGEFGPGDGGFGHCEDHRQASLGVLQDTVLEAYQALYGATTMVTGNKVTAQRCMPEGDEWLCLRFNDSDALKRASDALTLLEQIARRIGA